MKWAPLSASRSTCRPSATTSRPADEKVTIRDRDTMEQMRVSINSLAAVMDELMAGKWARVAHEHGVQKS